MSGTTNENSAKLILKANDQEFFVISSPGMAAKWRKDQSIPLIDVVQTFDVFTTSSGSITGEYIRPSKGTLESAFGTDNVDTIIKKIVAEGTEQPM
ncbi:ribosome maturation protein [Phycomyces nitens]|nr:ribosome maturation protein [Phycomyces nitens]